jgi:hypothetical protein
MNYAENIESSGSIKCNLPIWLLNIGLIYAITTTYYFFMNNITKDPVIQILEPFPKLKEHYKDTLKYTGRNLLLGMGIGIAVIIFIKPFGKFF